MKINILLFCFLSLLFNCSIYGQNQWTKQEKIIVEANLNLRTNDFQITKPASYEKDQVLKINSIALVDKDIIIQYKTTLPEGGQIHQSRIEFFLDGQKLNVEEEDLFGAINKSITFVEPSLHYQILWTRLLEKHIQLVGKLQIHLITEITGNRTLPFKVDCGIKPTFTHKQKIPFYAAAVVGAGSLIGSQILENKAQEDYINIYTTQKSGEAAEPIYQDINDRHHKALIMQYAGVAILVVDATWYLIRQIRYKKRLNTYNEFCNPESNLSIRPQLELVPTNATALHAGFKLKYRF